MKKESKGIGLRRLSMSPKSNFPPLSSHSYNRSEVPNQIQPVAVYSAPAEMQKTNCHKFFTLRPHYHPGSPNTDISTCRSAITSHGMYSSPKNLNSDILERIESYEIRSKKGNSLDSLTSNFNILEKCFEEIFPSLSEHECEIKDALVKFSKHFSVISRQVIKFSQAFVRESHEKVEKMNKDFVRVDGENKRVVQELKAIKEYKKLEMEKIDKEIEEIFGQNDLEIKAMRLSSKEHQDKFNQDTIDLLTQIWRSMDQVHDIPDIKNGDFLGMDPSEVPELLSKKLLFLQRFTARKVSDIFRTKKNLSNSDTQTYTEYISPTSFEEQSKQVEKLQIQLNSAFVSIEKYRESFGSKINVLENLESEKSHLLAEVTKLRKEVEGLSHTLEKSHFELKKVSSEFDSVKKEKEHLIKEKVNLQQEVSEREKIIISVKENCEKFEKSAKDKEEKIQGLEKSLAKRIKKKEDHADEQSLTAPGQQKRLSKFDEKEILSSLKSNKRGSRDSPTLSRNSISNSANPPNMPGQVPRSTSPDSVKLSTSHTNSSVPSNNKGKVSKKSSNDRAQSPTKRNLNIKLNQIDEVPSPTSKSAKRNDEKFPEINIAGPNKKSREKSRGTGTANDESEDFRQKSGKKKRRSRADMESGNNEYEDSYFSQDSNSDEINQDYNSGSSIYVKRPGNSRHSQISDVSKSRGSKRSRGSEFYAARTAANSKGTSVEDLVWENCLNYSKAVQMNGLGMPDEEKEVHDGVYLFPYNPNQFYALRGDKYYHTSGNVFAAQPRIPDLKSSVTFNSPYQLSPN